jgi:hypothetical protein
MRLKKDLQQIFGHINLTVLVHRKRQRSVVLKLIQ